MTFCLGVNVDEGLVGIADTRVVSGSESLTARKVATYQGPGYSFFIMNSGLRSLRDKVLLCFEEAFSQQIAARERLFKVVNLYAAQVRRLANEDTKSLEENDLHFNLYSLIGGQMTNDGSHRLFLVYRGELGRSRPRHAVSDHWQLGIREADSGALVNTYRSDSLCIQARHPRVRCHPAVRLQCGFPDRPRSLPARKL